MVNLTRLLEQRPDAYCRFNRSAIAGKWFGSVVWGDGALLEVWEDEPERVLEQLEVQAAEYLADVELQREAEESSADRDYMLAQS